MTFNLLYAGAVNPAGSWAERLPLVRDVLEGTGADVVALQEATVGQLHDLERVLTGFSIVPGPESGETRLPRVVQTATRLLRRQRRPPAHAREHPHPPHPIPHPHPPAGAGGATPPHHHHPLAHGGHVGHGAAHLPHFAHGYRRG